MPTLTITRGLPASGKTTWAKAWVAEDPTGRARVNRDDLRAMLNQSVFVKGVTEDRVLAVRDATISALLRKGVNVVVDDTNLPRRTARDLTRLASKAGAELAVQDFTDIPVETCIERDAARANTIGETRIRELWDRFLRGRSLPLEMPEETAAADAQVQMYEPKPGAPKAVLVDVDGTVALMNGRGPFDWARVGEDLPNQPVISVVQAMHAAGHQIVFMSGRSEDCRAETARWLRTHLPEIGRYTVLHMRASGDQRKDSIVKVELFNAHVRDQYDVVAVLDDRNQVVDAWRALGLTVLQVAPGDF